MFYRYINVYLDILIIFLVSVHISIHVEAISVGCDLKWVSEGFGNIPRASIESGSHEYVARVYHDDQWIPGRMSPSKGKIFITHDSQAIESDTYEILTNPDNCILEWADGYGGSVPENAVPVKPSGTDVYIGRGVIAGLTLGGKVVVVESAIFISYDGNEETRRSYQVLRSFYPPLKVRLSKFVFPNEKLVNKTEVLGQEDIRNAFNSDFVHTIDHGKIIQERFTLTENKSWEGFSQVSFSFPVWYGSSDVTAEFELDPDQPLDCELTVYREKELRVQKNINVKAASGASASHLQVCSTASIVEDLENPIEFKATATYEADKMTTDQIKEILTKLGRNIGAKKSSRKNSVQGEFSGKLNGRFAIHVSSYTSNVDAKEGVCFGYYS